MIKLTVDKKEERKLLRAFKQLPKAAAKKVVRGAARFAMTPVRKQIKANAPKDTKDMSRQVKTKMKTYNGGLTIAVVVGIEDKPTKSKKNSAASNPGIYSYFIEKGTSRIPANPFVLPALEGNQRTVLARYRSKVAAGLDKEVAKLRKGGK